MVRIGTMVLSSTLAVTAATCASAAGLMDLPCYIDPVTKEVVCPPEIVSGPDGGSFERLLKEMLAHPEWAMPDVKLDDNSSMKDKEIFRQWSEGQRLKLENFRSSLEENRSVIPLSDAMKGMEIYNGGIDKYQSTIKMLSE